MLANLIQAQLQHIEIIINISEEFMKAVVQQQQEAIKSSEISNIADLVKSSFAKIAPFWPLKNLIAVNPLQGFENMAIEEAMQNGAYYFEQTDLPQNMLSVNIETIKWLQAYFDEGQATIVMPNREKGLYAAWKELVIYDIKIHQNLELNKSFLRSLPKIPEQVISECLLRIGIKRENREQFLTLMLTTLPGWASYIKYRTEWNNSDANNLLTISQSEYLAMRLVITCLMWPKANMLIEWHQEGKKTNNFNKLDQIANAEHEYRKALLKELSEQNIEKPHTPEAQFVFCIDVRSEPFRKHLESTGDYQTLGFAGFFGVAVQVKDIITAESYSSCPVLLSPKHEVSESFCSTHEHSCAQKKYDRFTLIKSLYQSVKYSFTSPFALVETIGMFSGLFMAARSLTPNLVSKIKQSTNNFIGKSQSNKTSIDTISFEDKCNYAEGALKMMGLTDNFAPLVILCGHGSTTENNAYASALDCGACGGNHGASNARILAAILNEDRVRDYLYTKEINIPKGTIFIAALHNTTTDEVSLYSYQETPDIEKIKINLKNAQVLNNLKRSLKMGVKNGNENKTKLRSKDWAQVRPEWGLAKNAAFIVGPRDLTSKLDLDGRCFLHSYDYQIDEDGTLLTTILTAPMVVAQWINMQYLFSTIDNVAYGGGSKITKNITGKMGIMQGNASDLMTGLPLQSVYASDIVPYHEPQRLMCFVYAPKAMLDRIISKQSVLQKLFGNGWVQLACMEPNSNEIFLLKRDLKWQTKH